MVDLKKIINEATDKTIPTDGEKPKMGWKVKLAGILAIIGAAATALSQYLAG